MGDLEFTADMQPQFVGQMTQEQKNIIFQMIDRYRRI